MGLKHVSDSRSLVFADDVLRWTNGEGVDVVLNSIPGDGLRKGIELLRPYGRFVELGKRDIDENASLSLAAFNENIQFASVDCDRLLADRPDVCARLLADIGEGISRGHFTPLPRTTFAADDLTAAFRTLARGEHVGKVVVSLAPPPSRIAPPRRSVPTVVADGTYLVTGGLTGFGLEVARWLVAHGARRLVLSSRRGADTPGAASVLEELRTAGAVVIAERGDVSDRGHVSRWLRVASPAEAPFAASSTPRWCSKTPPSRMPRSTSSGA